MSLYSGGCLCRQITYTISSEPTWQFACHCNFCKNVSGTAFRTYCIFAKGDFKMSGSGLSEFDYISPDHGRRLTNQFCSKCGTPIGITIESSPDKQFIQVGTLDQRKDLNIVLVFLLMYGILKLQKKIKKILGIIVTKAILWL